MEMSQGQLSGRLPAAVLGNGSLLATLAETGRVEGLWWPHPDRAQHLGELRLGIEAGGVTRWLDEPPFDSDQTYEADASIATTTIWSGELEVVVNDLVDVAEPVLARRISSSVRDASLVVRCRPELDARTPATLPNGGIALVYSRGLHALALAVSRTAQAECNDGILKCSLHDPVQLVCAFGASSTEALDRAVHALDAGFEWPAERRRRADAARLDGAKPAEDERHRGLYRRSLLVFDALADRGGGVVAAPELDPGMVHSGGYGYVWARDLAFLILAFLAAGRFDLAERALRWLPRAQDEEGLWRQRHWTDGTLAPSWCVHQIDETGSVLFAYEATWRELRDERLDSTLWPSARRAADFLMSALDERGLPQPTADLWEERDGSHAYTAAAVVAGLRAAGSFAKRHEPSRADRYAEAAESVAESLERRFWSEDHGRYLRTLGDATVDASLLGLAWPFRAVDPGGERMRATVAAVERVLLQRGGGVLRYEGDTYAGGNAWVLAALWLGLWRRMTGDEVGHADALDYGQRVATPLGLLAEQVTGDGSPAWVLPLAWSHAMFVLAARPELAIVRAERGRTQPSPVRVTR